MNEFIALLNDRLAAKGLDNLDAEQTALLENLSNITDAVEMLHDFEARMGIKVDDVLQNVRAALFARMPETQEQALDTLRALMALGLKFHLDDEPEAPAFTAAEATFLRGLVDRLNVLFVACPDPESTNAGAWHAAELADWIGEGEPIAIEGWERVGTGGGCEALSHRVGHTHYLLLTDSGGMTAPTSVYDPCLVGLYSREHSEEILLGEWPTVQAFLRGERPMAKD